MSRGVDEQSTIYEEFRHMEAVGDSQAFSQLEDIQENQFVEESNSAGTLVGGFRGPEVYTT